MYDKVLVPLDGSPVAEVVLSHAIQLALAFGSEIVLFQAISRPEGIYDYMAREIVSDDAAIASAIAEADAYLTRVATKLGEHGVKAIRQEVRIGGAADQIVDFAKEAGVNIIAMATHGRSGISRWVYGSVAEKVLRGASTPVLLIRAGAAAE